MRKDKIIDEAKAIASTGALELVDGRAPNRIMLFPFGEVPTNDGRKPYVLEDAAHASAVIDATRAHLGRRDMMIDYDHQAERAPKVAGQAPASGWVNPATLEVGEDGIYGEVEWTAAARSALKDKLYRYISPWFGHTKDRRVTRLFNAALTNTPAFEMAAVASSTTENDMKDIALALGLEAEADEASIVSAIGDLKNSTSLTAIASALGAAEDATVEQLATAAATAKAQANPIDLAPIATALGLEGEQSVEQLATAAAQAKATGFDPTKFVPRDMYDKAIAKVEDAEEQSIASAVDAAIEAGKVTPANRDWAIGYATKDRAGFDAFAANTTAVLKEGEESTVAANIGSDTLTDEEKSTASVLGLTEDQFLATKKGDA